MINVKDFGAIGDGVADDRAAIQNALFAGAGGDIFFPDGKYLCGKGEGFWCLQVPGGMRLMGPTVGKAILLQAPVPGSVRLLQIDSPGVTVENLILDGNKALQTPDSHRSGVFVTAVDTIIRNVTTQNFTGDGLYFYSGADRFLVEDSRCSGNDRNGLTLGGSSDGGVVRGSVFSGNRAQQFDSEPGLSVISNLLLEKNVFDASGVTDYCLTVSGGSPTIRAHDWLIQDNVFKGGVFVVWATGITLRRNYGTNPTAHPNVTVYRSCTDVVIEDNAFVTMKPCVLGTISVVGTGEGGPSLVVVRRNKLLSDVFGIFCEGAVSVEVYDNDIIGAGTVSGGSCGVYLRSTVPTRRFASAIISRNRIRNFGARGVGVYSVGVSVVGTLVVSDNVFFDDAGTMRKSVDVLGTVMTQTVTGSVCLGGVVA